ncbi:MAG TPA: ABC transporter ATP-binding protein [Desulfarculaceae bacterium]|nr:ABC transporter ATP-binding protein [Desulfarculaceae bacterium]
MNYNTLTNTAILSLEGLSFHYPERPAIIDKLDFTLNEKTHIGIAAPNGSGKSTLFHLIVGLLKPTAGRITFKGRKISREEDFKQLRRQVGLLFQNADDQLFFPTVLEDVAFGPLNLGKSREEALTLSLQVLDNLGLADFADRITFKLSGGEKRLVALATVLAMEPEVLLLDEPTAGLDHDTKHKLIDLLNNFSDLSYLVVSHEFDFLTATTEHIYTMENGKILVDEELHIHHHEHAHRSGKQPHRHI